jgi:hypothetical protein
MNILFNRDFTKENATYFLRKSSSLFFLQELRPLTPLKEIDRFTSLTFIGMMKIMGNSQSFFSCNNASSSYNNDSMVFSARLNIYQLHLRVLLSSSSLLNLS